MAKFKVRPSFTAKVAPSKGDTRRQLKASWFCTAWKTALKYLKLSEAFNDSMSLIEIILAVKQGLYVAIL